MASSQHSRSSGSSMSSNGSAYQQILDHILTYPGSYEIPLRTMYTLNSQPRGAQTRNASSNTSNASSPISPQSAAFPDPQATETFTQSLMAQLSSLPSQATSLPPSFITSFVQRCFPAELTHVDFPQALTGLDYLKDLESRRRREVAAAMDRLEVDREALSRDDAEFSEKYPGVLQWVKSIEEKERKIDAIYTQVWVGIRRWIMINEMSLAPFNKHNCVAMLNTLFPPMGLPVQPTSRLTPAILAAQRTAFFKYIQHVEQKGSPVLRNIIEQGKSDGDKTGWPAVTRQLSMYLQLANSIISECNSIVHTQDLSPQRKREPHPPRHTRKADSGVSFTSDRRPSCASTAEPISPVEIGPPKTPLGGRSETALEKLARGLRGIGRSRTDVTEMISNDESPPAEKPKMLRKMRSFGSLGERKTSISGASGRETPNFDVEKMRQQRMKYEASVRPQPGKRSSNDV